MGFICLISSSGFTFARDIFMLRAHLFWREKEHWRLDNDGFCFLRKFGASGNGSFQRCFLFFLLIVLWHPMGGAKGNGFCMRDGFVDQDCLGAFAFFLFVCVVAELHEGIVHTIRPVAGLRVCRA
jgi:hypothetical protein